MRGKRSAPQPFQQHLQQRGPLAGALLDDDMFNRENRAPSGFSGVRGKKAPSGFAGLRGKKAPSGFTGLRGKKAPSGFAGLRGKKAPSGFAGLRGKKNYMYPDDNMESYVPQTLFPNGYFNKRFFNWYKTLKGSEPPAYERADDIAPGRIGQDGMVGQLLETVDAERKPQYAKSFFGHRASNLHNAGY